MRVLKILLVTTVSFYLLMGFFMFYLILKRKMLQVFESQDVKGLLDLYGYKDSYQIYTGYDYSKPLIKT